MGDALNDNENNSSAYSTLLTDGSIGEGWNLMSFPDQHLRYSSQGMKLQVSLAATAVDDINLSGPFGSSLIPIGGIAQYIPANYGTICQGINSRIIDFNNNGNSSDLDIRCYVGREADGDPAMFLVSTREFALSWALDEGTMISGDFNATTLGGQPLFNDNNITGADSNNTWRWRTRPGEYVLAFDVNNTWCNMDQNISMLYGSSFTDEANGTQLTAETTGALPGYDSAAGLIDLWRSTLRCVGVTSEARGTGTGN